MTLPATVVAYVLGKGRSGSTLLDAILGQLPGVFSAGELRTLWSWGYQHAADCSCGRPVRECPVWSAVVAETLGTATPTDAQIGALVDQQARALRWRQVPGALAGATTPALTAYAETQARLYRAIVAVTGAEVIVDSSKWPAHPGVLGRIDGVEPRILHLVRDPRAVAFSYRRHKPTGGRQPAMPRFGVAYSATSWLARNAAVEVARRGAPSQRLLYEEFAARPREALAAAATLLDRDPSDLPFVGARTVRLGATHLVGGNPGRFGGGEVTIQPDAEWSERLSARDAAVVTAVTAPLLGRYGYRRNLQSRPGQEPVGSRTQSDAPSGRSEPSATAPEHSTLRPMSDHPAPEPEVVP